MRKQAKLDLLRAARVAITATGLVLSGGGTVTEASATSEETVHIEQFVSADNSEITTLTQMLVYTDDAWIAALIKPESTPVLVNVHIGLEDGATVLQFTSSAVLDPNDGYTPIDLDVRFQRDGAFSAKMQLEIIVDGRSIPHTKHFWIARDHGVTTLISFKEYRTWQIAQVKPLPSDITANLEPGDVPGERTFPPGLHLCKGGVLCRD